MHVRKQESLEILLRLFLRTYRHSANMAQWRVYSLGLRLTCLITMTELPTISIVDTWSIVKEPVTNDHHTILEEGSEGPRGFQTSLDASCQSTVMQWVMWPCGQNTTHTNLGDTGEVYLAIRLGSLRLY